MSEAKHTPGPWAPTTQASSAPIGARAVCAPGYGGRNPLVCGVEYSKGGPILFEESVANARLIAAAPELLQALQETLAVLKTFSPQGAAVERAQAVIAKATGAAA